MVSGILVGLVCVKRCSVQRVAAEFAFFPPNPPTYALEPDARTGEPARLVYQYPELRADPFFQALSVLDGRPDEHAPRAKCVVVTTRRRQRVPLFTFEPPRAPGGAPAAAASPPPLTVLFCHANATDCGMMLPFYSVLARRLRVRVAAVEYAGYGAATGAPSVNDAFADAEAAYDELLKRGTPAERIVAYGQSIGSAPACRLAARRAVRGVILHSPIASGLRTISLGGCCAPASVLGCMEPFQNVRHMRKIECPSLIIHGTADEEIPIAHAKMLYAAARRAAPPFWVKGAGHNDVVEHSEEEYFRRVGAFLAALDEPDPGEPGDDAAAGPEDGGGGS